MIFNIFLYSYFTSVYLFQKIFIYLAVPGLSAACGIQFLDQGLNPDPLHWEPRVLATRSPGKSTHIFFGEVSLQIFFLVLSWDVCFLIDSFIYLFYIDLQCYLLSAIQQSDSVIHIYSLLKYSFPLWFIIGCRIWFPVLYGRTLLFIYSIFNSLHLLTPTFHSIPPPTPSLGNCESVLYIHQDSFILDTCFQHLGKEWKRIFLIAYSICIHNCHKLEATKISFKR